MSDRPRFNVIVPLHNKAETIERCVQSISAQSVQPDYIVVVNDASTDSSVEMLSALALPNLRVFDRTVPGNGGYAARNFGVEQASSEWVSFLDADDTWEPNHLAAASDIILANPDVNAIFFGRSIHSDDGLRDIAVSVARVYTFEELLARLAKQNLFHINALIIRRSVYRAMGGFHEDRGWRRGGDTEFFLRVIRDAGPVYCSPRVTSLYDTRYSEVIGNPTNVMARHPVLDTVEETLQTHAHCAAALKRLANRKTIEWIRSLRGSPQAAKKDLLSTVYAYYLTPRDCVRLIRALSGGLLKH